MKQIMIFGGIDGSFMVIDDNKENAYKRVLTEYFGGVLDKETLEYELNYRRFHLSETYPVDHLDNSVIEL